MNPDQISQSLSEFLISRFPALNDSLTPETSLIDSGAVDSLGILEVVGFLGEQFGIEIEDDDFEPENFENINSLTRFIIEKRA
ncbi:MAG: acyl carrier protein [Burkholderiaceae bacterium]